MRKSFRIFLAGTVFIVLVQETASAGISFFGHHDTAPAATQAAPTQAQIPIQILPPISPAISPEELTRLQQLQRPIVDAIQNQAEAAQGTLTKLMKNPFVQGSAKLVSDSTFIEDFNTVTTNPDRVKVLYYELGWILIVLMIRAWRSSVAPEWYKKFWVGIWTMALFWIGAFFIPVLILGDPYRRVLSTVGKTFFHSIKGG